MSRQVSDVKQISPHFDVPKQQKDVTLALIFHRGITNCVLWVSDLALPTYMQVCYFAEHYALRASHSKAWTNGILQGNITNAVALIRLIHWGSLCNCGTYCQHSRLNGLE